MVIVTTFASVPAEHMRVHIHYNDLVALSIYAWHLPDGRPIFESCPKYSFTHSSNQKAQHANLSILLISCSKDHSRLTDHWCRLCVLKCRSLPMTSNCLNDGIETLIRALVFCHKKELDLPILALSSSLRVNFVHFRQPCLTSEYPFESPGESSLTAIAPRYSFRGAIFEHGWLFNWSNKMLDRS
jgi:hypothetical protein